MSEWEGLTPPYRTLLADPPWPYRRRGPQRSRPDGVREAFSGKPWPYTQMNVEDIALLRVHELAADDARLFFWTTPKFLEVSFKIIRLWGFEPGLVLTWCKQPRGTQFVTTEFLIRSGRGRPPRVPWMATTWFTWRRPPGHSEKPGASYDLIENQSLAPRLELFARQPRLGWDSWGLGYESEPEAM